MRQSALAAGLALVGWLGLLHAGFAAWAQLAGFAFVALAALTAAHLAARRLRAPAASPCRSCEQRRRAWRRRNFWRLLRSRLRRPWRGPAAPAQRAGRCRSCGERTTPEQMDAQPPADAGLRHVVERSPQFAVVADRLVQPEPVDSWQADMLHYFVYALRPQEQEPAAHALFVARWEDDLPVSATVIVEVDGAEPQVRDLTATVLAQGARGRLDPAGGSAQASDPTHGAGATA